VASVAFGGSSSVGIGVPAALKRYSPADVQAQTFGKGAKEYSAAIQKQDQLIDSSISSEDKAKFKAFADTITKSSSSLSTVLSDNRSGKEISSRLTESTARSERAEANLREQSEFSESLASAYQRGESISKDLAKDPRNVGLFEQLLQNEAGGSAAALVRLESFLGNITRTPMPISNASRLPTSFNGISEEYRQSREELRSAADVDEAMNRYRDQVTGRPVPDSAAHLGNPKDERSSLRKAVDKAGEDLEGRGDQRMKQFEDEGVSRTEGNHVVTDRSLFEKATTQMKEDPDVVARKLKEVMSKIERGWK
jgi:conjugal transfer mating pair stabilization protein TraG